MISFQLTDEQELIRDTLREFANDELRTIGRECDEASQIPDDFLNSVWELGLTSTQLPAASGGAGAVIGIVWLVPIFAVYFATKLIGASGTFWKNLVKTLFYYGLAARIPVLLIMGLAIFGEWGTHYDAFPPDFPATSAVGKFLLGGVAAQLVVWVGIWTVGVGTLVGVIASKILGSKSATAQA